MVIVASWLISDAVADRLAQREVATSFNSRQGIVVAQVRSMTQTIASDLALARAIPATIAEVEQVQRALEHAEPIQVIPGETVLSRRDRLIRDPQLLALDDFLHRADGFAAVDDVWVINTHGLCVAASTLENITPIGLDLSARSYTTEGLLGQRGEHYLVSLISGTPGIFVSVPVYSADRLVGVVVAKLDITRLRRWVTLEGTLVTDENGVIIMASDTRYESQIMANAPIEKLSEAVRRSYYQRTHFTPFRLELFDADGHSLPSWVPAEIARSLYRVDGGNDPLLMEVRTGLNSGLAAYVLAPPFDNWEEMTSSRHRNQVMVFLLISGGSAFVMVLALFFLREYRLHHDAIDMAAQLSLANTMLSEEARYDMLTGALSRRYFLGSLKREIETACLEGAPLCIALADLDHFKQVNDVYGHPMGDRVLRYFVDTARLALRDTDLIGRLGGEEFGIVLPGATARRALEAVERIRIPYSNHHLAGLPPTTKLTVSFGIVQLRADDTVERLMSRADKALYVAKSMGRDRSVAFDLDREAPLATDTLGPVNT